VGHSIPVSHHLGPNRSDGGALPAVCGAAQWTIRYVSSIHFGHGRFEHHGGIFCIGAYTSSILRW
jgi:hypothetical protein